MNIRTILIERYVNFVDSMLCEHARCENTAKKNNTYFKTFIVLIFNIASMYSLFLLFLYLNECKALLLCFSNTINEYYLFFKANV